jgi:hypothetical protein
VPVFLLVLASFAQRSEGADASIRVLRGGVIGSFAFAVFFLVVGIGLGRIGIGATYALGSASAIVVNAAVLSMARSLLRLQAAVALSAWTDPGLLSWRSLRLAPIMA